MRQCPEKCPAIEICNLRAGDIVKCCGLAEREVASSGRLTTIASR